MKAEEPLKLRSRPPDDMRIQMYDNIARVHKRIVEAKWRARTCNQPLKVDPGLMLHHDDCIAFLAEQVLKLQAIVESIPEKLEETKKMLQEETQ